jgi:threonine/homoserine/homoserine lactone efflux protein
MNTLTTLATVIAVPAVTPGPNNFIIMAQSAAMGMRRAIPAILAVAVGSALMLALVLCLNAFVFLERFEQLIGVAGSLLLAGLAIQQWMNAGRPTRLAAGPARALALISFQWVNPKAWVLMIVIATAANSAAISPWRPIALLFSISIASSMLWASLGTRLSRFRSDSNSARWLGRGLAGVLFLTATQLFLTQLGVFR